MAIVGTWVLDTDSEYRIYTFHADGTGTESEPDYYTGLKTWDITYLYNPEAGTLIIMDEQGDIEEIYNNVSITGDYLFLTRENSYHYVFTRSDGTSGGGDHNISIVGTWVLDTDAEYRIYTFHADGTGTESEPDYYTGLNTWDITYVYNPQDGTLLIFDEYGDLDIAFYNVRISGNYLFLTNDDWYDGTVIFERSAPRGRHPDATIRRDVAV